MRRRAVPIAARPSLPVDVTSMPYRLGQAQQAIKNVAKEVAEEYYPY